MKSAKFIELVEKFAPISGQYEWDNCGFNVLTHDEIRSVITCINLTAGAIEYAQSVNADTIISHHPLIIGKFESVDFTELKGSLIIKLTESGLNHFCAHTCFDRAKNGLSRDLGEKLGLGQMQYLCDMTETGGLGVVGEFEKKINTDDLIALVKKTLNCEYLITNDIAKNIKKVAICTGGAGEYWSRAKSADAYIVGEMKYHEFAEASHAGLLVIAAGHFETEVNFVDLFASELQNRTKKLKIHKFIDDMQYSVIK